MKVRPVFLFVVIAALISSMHSNKQIEVRLMSYNIKATQSSSISQIVNVINDQDPDVVALQEVDVNWGERSNYRNQIKLLGEKLEMYYYFGEIYSLPPANNQKKRKYGLAFLSKYPIVSKKNNRITRLSSLTKKADPQKLPGFLEILVSIEGQRIQLFNTHLDYRRDITIRKQQVTDMMPHLIAAEYPFVLLGDLNAEPNNSEISELFTLLNDPAKEEDTEILTYPAESPGKRIDYILYSEEFSSKKIIAAKTQASDHRPVIVDLTLKLSE